MITAVDTSVLLDVFLPDLEFGPASRDALRNCLREGRLVACLVVWAEVASVFPSPSAAQDAMSRLDVGFSETSLGAALGASRAWRAYRERGGRRARVAADFLIGAHAISHADRLLTRDRGFYRGHFSGLRVLDPSPG
jgi:hypothetical protein